MKWPSRDDFAEVTFEESLVGNLYGRLELAIAHMGLTLRQGDWVALPPKKAIEHFKGLNIMPRKAFDKLSDTLKRRSFTVAYLHHDYELSLMHDMLTKAMEDGTSRAAFVRQAKERFGDVELARHHLETVHSTNILGAYQHGRWETMSTPEMMEERPFWEYHTAGDKRVRPTHAEMHGKVYAADDPVWTTWYPPNGYRCRCTILPLTKLERRRVQKKPPTVEPDKGFAGRPTAGIAPIKTAPRVLPKRRA